MKVYVVSFRPNDEDRIIDSVWTDEGNAYNVSEALCNTNDGEPGDVQEFELDEDVA